MRKWKCLPGGEEQLSAVAETQGPLSVGLPLVVGQRALRAVVPTPLPGLKLWEQNSGSHDCKHPWGPSWWRKERDFFDFLPLGAWPVSMPSYWGYVELSSIALPTARLRGWQGVKHPSSVRLGCFSARLGGNQGQAETQQKTLQFCAKFVATRTQGALIQWVIVCSY